MKAPKRTNLPRAPKLVKNKELDHTREEKPVIKDPAPGDNNIEETPNEEVITKTPYFKTKKGKRTLIGLIVGTLLTVGIALTYYFVITGYLLDVQHLPYIRYRYTLNLDEEANEKPEVEIVLIQGDDIPEDFYVPSKIEGMPVTKIKAEAFKDITNIKTVRLPKTISVIEDRVFSGCTSLESLKYDGELSQFGIDVFQGTPFLENFGDDAGFVYFANAIMAYQGHVQYPTIIAASSESAAQFETDNPDATVIDLSQFSSNTLFGDSIFAGQDGISHVELPAGTYNISNNLFNGCSNLQSVDFSYIANDKDNTYTLGNGVFENCSSLNLSENGVFELPENINKVGNRCFKNTATTGEVRVRNIAYGQSVFEKSTKLETVSIYDDVKVIPNSMFRDSTALKTLQGINSAGGITNLDQITDIEARAFQGCGFTEFTFPKQIAAIAPSVLADCLELERVIMYDSGPRLFGEFAFRNNPSLEKFVLLDDNGAPITTDHDITFPSTTTSISYSTGSVPLSGLFGAYTNPDGSTSNIMADERAAPQFKSILIPASVPIIGTHMFYGNINLEKVDFAVDEEGVSNVQHIGTYAFYYCKSLLKIELPDKLTSLQISAFEECNSLNEFTFSNYERFTTLLQRVLSGTNISKVVVPKNISLISDSAISRNPNLKSIIFESENATSQKLAQFRRNALVDNHEDLKLYFNIDRTTLDYLVSNRWDADWNLKSNSGGEKAYYEYFALGEWQLNGEGEPEPLP